MRWGDPGQPEYTGRQVWNKQRTDEMLLDVDDAALGHTSIMRWNPSSKWIVSKDVVHESLVSDEVFEVVQQQLIRRARSDTLFLGPSLATGAEPVGALRCPS